MSKTCAESEHLMSWAHTIMCNVDNGDPSRPRQTQEWRDAMRAWENAWLGTISKAEPVGDQS